MTTATTIMLVEDDPVSRHIITHLLERSGYRMVVAADGVEALGLLSPEVDILILDWMMPRLDGVQLCRRLRSSEPTGFRYVIMMTARTEKEDVVQALEMGADDYMIKPVDHQELLARIRAGERIIRRERALSNACRVARDEAYRDKLTGLFNRRYFDQALARQLSCALQEGGTVALVLMDLDHFKRINDLHGHAVGDEVLWQVGRAVAREVREGTDVAARYGGDELAVIGPNTDLLGAQGMAERIRARVAGLRVPAGEGPISVTLSAGVAVSDGRTPEHGDPLRSLVQAADGRLYQAKLAGRNRVAA